jgi:predicted dienelactone hydrolase
VGQFKVGFRQGLLFDHDRRTWLGDGPRPIHWSAWYPAAENAVERVVTVPPDRPFFIMGKVGPGAELCGGPERFPVILLSHGTGGTAVSLGWLAERFAATGYVVIGVDHHGNTASEPYRAEGFLCWWERPRDLSVALDALISAGAFANRLDVAKVTAVGFSLGGYTVMSILGGITDMTRFEDWDETSPLRAGPREFPGLINQVEPLLRNSAVFRSSWEMQSASYIDHRVKNAIALAPAPTVRALTLTSLAAIARPVTIMVSGADREAPAESCAAWLNSKLPNSQISLLGHDVGHYTLLCIGTNEGRRLEPGIWADMPSVNRNEIHRKAFEIALKSIKADVPGVLGAG